MSRMHVEAFGVACSEKSERRHSYDRLPGEAMEVATLNNAEPNVFSLSASENAPMNDTRHDKIDSTRIEDADDGVSKQNGIVSDTVFLTADRDVLFTTLGEVNDKVTDRWKKASGLVHKPCVNLDVGHGSVEVSSHNVRLDLSNAPELKAEMTTHIENCQEALNKSPEQLQASAHPEDRSTGRSYTDVMLETASTRKPAIKTDSTEPPGVIYEELASLKRVPVETVIEINDLIPTTHSSYQEPKLKKTTSLTVPGSDSYRDERSPSLASTWFSTDEDYEPPANDEHENVSKKAAVLVKDDSFIKAAIPCLPLGLAVVCLVLNIVLPGIGTVVSGLCVLCCGHSRIETRDDTIMTTVCINVWVGLTQLLTITYLFVGWFWSLAWGIKMVYISLEFRQEEKTRREKELQTLALSAFGSASKVFMSRLGRQTTTS